MQLTMNIFNYLYDCMHIPSQNKLSTLFFTIIPLPFLS